MLGLIESALDLVNAVTGKRAAAKRLLKAQEKYGDTELVAVLLGRQTLILSRPLLEKMNEAGLWGLLLQAAERGEDLATIS